MARFSFANGSNVYKDVFSYHILMSNNLRINDFRVVKLQFMLSQVWNETAAKCMLGLLNSYSLGWVGGGGVCRNAGFYSKKKNAPVQYLHLD